MPQSERSAIIIEFLKWLEARTKQGGASRHDCIRHVHVEITRMGAEEKRCENYLRDCVNAKLVQVDGLKFKITTEGASWLKRKG